MLAPLSCGRPGVPSRKRVQRYALSIFPPNIFKKISALKHIFNIHSRLKPARINHISTIIPYPTANYAISAKTLPSARFFDAFFEKGSADLAHHLKENNRSPAMQGSRFSVLLPQKRFTPMVAYRKAEAMPSRWQRPATAYVRPTFVGQFWDGGDFSLILRKNLLYAY